MAPEALEHAEPAEAGDAGVAWWYLSIFILKFCVISKSGTRSICASVEAVTTCEER